MRPLCTTVEPKQGDILSTIFFNLHINDLLSALVTTANNENAMLNTTDIYSLLLAYALAIFSSPHQGLQQKIDSLEKYSLY